MHYTNDNNNNIHNNKYVHNTNEHDTTTNNHNNNSPLFLDLVVRAAAPGLELGLDLLVASRSAMLF